MLAKILSNQEENVPGRLEGLPKIKKPVRLEDLLLKDKIITEEQLAKAYAIRKTEGGVLGSVLVREGMIKEPTLEKYLRQVFKSHL